MQTKAVVRRLDEEVWKARDPGAIEALMAPDVVIHDSMDAEPQHGPAAARASVEAMLGAFPDADVEYLHVVAEDDLVAVRFRASGTHQGEFRGIPPTGKRIEVAGMSVMRVRDERIVEEWQLVDSLGLLQQLGAAPT